MLVDCNALSGSSCLEPAPLLRVSNSFVLGFLAFFAHIDLSCDVHCHPWPVPLEFQFLNLVCTPEVNMLEGLADELMLRYGRG